MEESIDDIIQKTSICKLRIMYIEKTAERICEESCRACSFEIKNFKDFKKFIFWGTEKEDFLYYKAYSLARVLKEMSRNKNLPTQTKESARSLSNDMTNNAITNDSVDNKKLIEKGYDFLVKIGAI
jgi:hypothetical protein